MKDLLIIGGFFLASVVFSIVVFSLLLRFIKTLGTKNQEENLMIKWSNQTKPAIGGIGFFVCFVIAAIGGLLVADKRILDDVQLAGMLSAVCAGFMLGLADDAYNTRPLLKFLGQIACGLLLYFTGNGIVFFDSQSLCVLATVFWVVTIMNSINMLDNMDGISGNVSAIILMFFGLLLFFLSNQISALGIMILGVVASLFGFMRFNNHPSEIFMGDSGSMFLGVILAVAGIKLGWNNVAGNNNLLLVAVFTVLAFWSTLNDTFLVTINRLRHGTSPFVGGRDHTTHNLGYLGLADGMVMLVFRLFSLINVFIAWLVIAEIWPIWSGIAYLLGTHGVFHVISARNLKMKKYQYAQTRTQ